MRIRLKGQYDGNTPFNPTRTRIRKMASAPTFEKPHRSSALPARVLLAGVLLAGRRFGALLPGWVTQAGILAHLRDYVHPSG
jgi:hypothetical protein